MTYGGGDDDDVRNVLVYKQGHKPSDDDILKVFMYKCMRLIRSWRTQRGTKS